MAPKIHLGTYEVNLPTIDADVLARNFILRQAKRKVEVVANKIGEDNLRWMIENNKSLYDFLRPLTEASDDEIKSSASTYKNFAGKVTNRELKAVLPQWAQDVVESYGPQGQLWLSEQIQALRDLIK
ncbi:MAG: hypothetical protein ACYDHZ_00635 [Dehalococcoidia bacterium]